MPDMENDTQKFLAQTLQDLRDNKDPFLSVYGAIYDLAKAHYTDAIPTIETFLVSEDESARDAAIAALTIHFDLQRHWETARSMLESDPDDNVRMTAASGLQVLKRNTKDRATLTALAKVVNKRDEDRILRKAAYRAMLGVISYDPREQGSILKDTFVIDRDADWHMIDSYLDDNSNKTTASSPED